MDILTFLANTEGFADITFKGFHNDFSIDFIRDCYYYYQLTQINLLEIMQDFYTLSWNLPDGHDFVSDISDNELEQYKLLVEEDIINRHFDIDFLESTLSFAIEVNEARK